ncbi:hypothetical protein AXG93_698s1290 [Marchantia polymorpha subsp. ruderalis]|uniref:Uncharacterized protein n=1 Tax=Marchantia polymorpha subsp. ruderalis TaxID=1480154 RepID=A0A176VEY4_MARPO|nr:hypothetical protein AXG93_698s1290 [Marchantia polymorpha subsp. ruderalis]
MAPPASPVDPVGLTCVLPSELCPESGQIIIGRVPEFFSGDNRLRAVRRRGGAYRQCEEVANVKCKAISSCCSAVGYGPMSSWAIEVAVIPYCGESVCGLGCPSQIPVEKERHAR